jgi:hypothetical protein
LSTGYESNVKKGIGCGVNNINGHLLGEIYVKILSMAKFVPGISCHHPSLWQLVKENFLSSHGCKCSNTKGSQNRVWPTE